MKPGARWHPTLLPESPWRREQHEAQPCHPHGSAGPQQAAHRKPGAHLHGQLTCKTLHCTQVKLSPSGGRIAFTVKTDAGSEAARAYVRELPLGCALVWDLAELESVGTLEWLGEGHMLFTVPDAAGRPHQVPRRRTAFPLFRMQGLGKRECFGLRN